MQQTFTGGVFTKQEMKPGANYKRLQACKAIDISDFTFDAINMTGAAIFEIYNSPSVVIKNITIANTNMKNFSKIINIVNSQSVRLEGEIKLVNVTISERSTFIYVENSIIESLGT